VVDSPPVFILGIMPRCGTNFLSNLLLLHPACVPRDTVWEDFTVAHTDLLMRYSDRVAQHWDTVWGVSGQTRDELNHSLGTGLSRFLTLHSRGHRVVSKTPSVDKLELFFRFFPDAPLLILVRDGRAILESGIRSFGWNREANLHRLASAADKIAEFKRTHDDKVHRYLIVKYEDLWQRPAQEMREILEFLDLATDEYDFDQAAQLPVRGSSDLVHKGDESLHWKPVDKKPEFDPLSRFEHWTPAMHYRYNQVAGKPMEALGYKRVDSGRTSLIRRLTNLALDTSWLLIAALRPIHKRLRNRQTL
jgi:hypothetical protein